jgi:RNA polymerase sigma-70 factor (sigma-E family)
MTADADFAALFAARARAIRRTAYLLCGDWGRAEDLTQTAFAKLYAAWPRLHDPNAAEGYLRRALTSTYVDESRRAWRGEHPTDELPEVVDRDSPPSDDRLMLLAALTHVPPRQRACLVLRYFDDLSVEMTAATLGCSVGTVKSNTARGLDALRRALGDAMPDLVLTGRDLS